jgi:cholinesterase
MNGVKAYRYRYFGDWPNLNISYGTGAFHSAEVPMVFGNAALLTGVPNTLNEALVSAYMMGIWAAFAKDPDNALSLAGWPTYKVDGELYSVELGLSYADRNRFDTRETGVQ